MQTELTPFTRGGINQGGDHRDVGLKCQPVTYHIESTLNILSRTAGFRAKRIVSMGGMRLKRRLKIVAKIPAMGMQ